LFNKSFLVSYLMLGVILLLTTIPVIQDFLGPNPYKYVKEIKVAWSEDVVDLSYSFVKNGDCTLQRFSVVGIDTLPQYLEYTDGNNLGKNFNRDAGTQGLNISVPLMGFNIIEIRTVHQCGDKRVSKVFARLERP